jgi:hypothetical protein
LEQLEERVRKLEIEKEAPEVAREDGKRRVLACSLVDAVERSFFGSQLDDGMSPEHRASLENQFRGIMRAHGC